ncbi:MAG: glucose-6-phosphate isomerase [Planctomycetales bacterium]|nr:glucose-6-phosphate isomerase [Planctomycetales bacterium]
MKSAAPLLRYDYSGALLEKGGLTGAEVHETAGILAGHRDEIFDVDLPAFAAGQSLPGKDPLDTAFVDMPQRLLAEYETQRDGSELGQILATAKRLSDSVDRVAVLGIGGSYMGARALMEACCHPYHNELDRGARGGKPRMYFEGNNVDNDAIQAVLDMLPCPMKSSDPIDRWAVVVISKSGGTLETAAAFRVFADRLSHAVGGDATQIAQLIVPVTGETGKLRNLANALGCVDTFRVPDGVGGRFSVLSPVGLLPAALLGLDIVKLLQGAVAMTEHFRHAPYSDNAVLNYTAVSHLMERKHNATIRVLQVWSKTLESLGLWYDQLLAESLGKNGETGATPLTVVNTRDLHSRAQQHQEGRRDKMYTNLLVENWRRDPVRIPSSDLNQDNLNQLAGKSFADLMTAAATGTNQAYNGDGRPTADLFIPAVNEHTLGQFLQMMMLSTVIEGRLLQVNPYGQPGVEAYKKNMQAALGMK